MEAVQVTGAHAIRRVTMPKPVPGPGEALIEVAASGICGTDHHIVAGAYAANLPRVLGHELSGVIAALGSETPTTLPVGTPVALDPNIACHGCSYCRRGDPHFCPHRQAIGVDRDGGFAEWTVAPVAQLYRLPAGLAVWRGALAEPVSCCLRGIDNLALRSGETAMVVGMGPIGVIIAQLLWAAGAAWVVGLETNDARRGMAAELGIEVYGRGEEAALAVKERAAEGPTVVVDAVGSAAVLEYALQVVARGGKVLVFGVAATDQRARVSPHLLYEKELTIVSAYTNPFTMARAVAVVASGKLAVEGILNRPLDLDGVAAALRDPARSVGLKRFLRLDR